RLSARNNILLVYKNMPFIQRLINFPFLLIGFVIKFMFFQRLQLGKAYLEGFKEGVRTAKMVTTSNPNPVQIKPYILIQCELVRYTLSYAISKLLLRHR